MRKRTFVILLALAIATLAIPVPVHSATGADGDHRQWKKWGVEPYASTKEAACSKAPAAIGAFTMPSEVKQYFMETIGAACSGGKEVWLTPNMVLEQMWTGGGKPHVMDRRSVAELPVLTSPDGHPYRKGSVAQAVKASSWAAVHEGKMYILYLPLVCFNWSWAYGADVPLPPPSVPQVLAKATVAEKCATVEYTVMLGDQVRFAVFAQERLPASACWQLCDGKSCSAPPSPCDSCDWNDSNGPKSVIPEGFEPVHTGTYVATEVLQSLRFPRKAMNSYVALCVERDEAGASNSWVVPPSVWDGVATKIVVPYGGQKWPSWEDDISK